MVPRPAGSADKTRAAPPTVAGSSQLLPAPLPCAPCRIPVFQAGGRRPATGRLAARASGCGSSPLKAASISPPRSASFPVLAGGRPPTMRTPAFLPRRSISGAMGDQIERPVAGSVRPPAVKGMPAVRWPEIASCRLGAPRRGGHWHPASRPRARQQVAAGPASASGLSAWRMKDAQFRCQHGTCAAPGNGSVPHTMAPVKWAPSAFLRSARYACLRSAPSRSVP